MDEQPQTETQVEGAMRVAEPAPAEDPSSTVAAAQTEASFGAARSQRAERRPWWRRLLVLVVEVAIIVAVAAAIPRALAWMLDTPHPLATITSSSMWPTLKRGDLVLIKGRSAEPIVPGMIVVYNDAMTESMIIHRVVEVDGTTVVTRGDANTRPDDPISMDSIVGIVPTVRDGPVRVPYVGYVTLWTRGGQ